MSGHQGRRCVGPGPARGPHTRLSLRQQAAIEDLYREGLSLRDTAGHLEVARSTVLICCDALRPVTCPAAFTASNTSEWTRVGDVLAETIG
ncbi:helix-turn-helix domain-containing protein [Nocardioides caricicola]|uniref:Helix-turn-helix domain-containing protein n=1 Tax=Nocardioides caricicola TaxID=634770 RepID=A0ABW0N550_9ACTN